MGGGGAYDYGAQIESECNWMDPVSSKVGIEAACLIENNKSSDRLKTHA